MKSISKSVLNSIIGGYSASIIGGYSVEDNLTPPSAPYESPESNPNDPNEGLPGDPTSGDGITKPMPGGSGDNTDYEELDTL